jgi:periplasmic divalent cation tolerance protein
MRVILCTCPPAEAERIARALVEAGAACVNILPGVRSFYRWKGELQDDSESLLLIKADAGIVGALEQRLKGVHPYELPEWVVLTPDEALTSEPYRRWVSESPGK